MRWSQFFLPTRREDPKDAEAISHKLMMRAGLIRRLGAGSYSYLPLGLRVLQKVIAIIREEMNRAGAQECLLPALHPIELWKATGRDRVLGEVLLRLTDRTGKELVLGPTHEEVITDLVSEIKSHRQLPLTLYQIQTKFRDEPRPRSGVIRSKEFLMKDAYSFDVDPEGLANSYERMKTAYERIFARCGVSVRACEASSGAMGGDVSHEFMAEADSGEDIMVRCAGCAYAANLEAATCAPLAPDPQPAEPPKPMEQVKTPGQHTVEQVSRFLKVQPSRLIKTLMCETERGPIAALIRGDHELNESKLARVAAASELKLASAATIERLTGAPVGFAGPVRLGEVSLIADLAVMTVVNGVTGANAADAHLVGVNPVRDFQPTTVADIRHVTAQDRCRSCGQPLQLVPAIEMGHVFKLGTKYSQALGAVVQDQRGQASPMVMGCYGVGVNRIVAAAIEQHHDAAGIIWPVAISPFHVLVSVLEASNPALVQVAAQAVDQLEQAGLEVLWDDREQSPGSKLKDADLVGIPVQVIIGRLWEREQNLEVVERASKTKHPTALTELVSTAQGVLAALQSA